MDTANLDVRVKKKAVIELAGFGYSLGVISTILGIRYNIAERALINELEIYNEVNLDFPVKTIEKKCPYSIISQIKSYGDIYEITIFYKMYISINSNEKEEQPNAFSVALAYFDYVTSARDRKIIPIFSHINQAFNLISYIIQGLITVTKCSACGDIYVYPTDFGGLECPLCRLKNVS